MKLPPPTGPRSKTNRLAIASLAAGIFPFLAYLLGECVTLILPESSPISNFFFSKAGIGGVVFGLTSMVLGILAFLQIRRSAGKDSGLGLAVLGIVLGCIACTFAWD